jgi:hypothetical protein
VFETHTNERDRGQASVKHYGKYPGLVISNTPPENDPENPKKIHRGELYVEVPAILEESPDGKSQQPIQVWAKPCFHPGFFFIPEIGAQVWVEFAAGDLNAPLWTGVWYPLKETPKTAAEKAPTVFQKVVRTASGHVTQLDDQNGNVLIANGQGSSIFLNGEDQEATFFDQHGNFVKMGNDGIAIVNKDGTLIELREGKVTVIASDMVHLAAKDVVLESATVTLGKGATEPVVLGQTFANLWNQFIFHTHATAVGPSGPPVPPVTPLVAAPGQGLSTAVKVK